jgi:hypothetical protein
MRGSFQRRKERGMAWGSAGVGAMGPVIQFDARGKGYGRKYTVAVVSRAAKRELKQLKSIWPIRNYTHGCAARHKN